MSEFAELVDAHYQGLFRFAVSLTRDADRAADLVQETFCIWAEKGSQLKDRSKAKTWLFTTLFTCLFTYVYLFIYSSGKHVLAGDGVGVRAGPPAVQLDLPQV